MKIHNFEQYSPEWWQIREKRMTASKAACVQANGKGLITYISEIMSAYYSNSEPIRYTNEAMERGSLLEADARLVYSLKTGLEVKEVGFFSEGKYIGASPDGLIGDDGLLEIKCPTDKVYFEYMLDRKIKSDYLWQMHFQMMVTEREWCDYCVFSPNFDENIIIQRVYRDESKISKIKAGIETGIDLIKSIEEQMEGLK